MSKINILSNQIINQIAAGEIIERPFAVVRELVDNSLDAGAQNIKILLEAGGIQRIEVEDNGIGISESELDLAVTRHATSKIKSEEDLAKIASLGFRGEALASIASVSQFSIESSNSEESLASKISIFGGDKKDGKSSQRKQGTTVVVKNIFYNVPARKKFLKKPQTEQSKILQWVKQIALTRPDVSFTLIADSKEILKYPACDSIESRAKKVFKTKNLSYYENLSGDYHISLYLSHPIDAKQKASNITLLVNNRVISDSTLLRAIKEAYGNTLKPREYPEGFIHLNVPPYDIDVNVHPQKSEVRFGKQSFVFQFVLNSVKECLNKLLSGNEHKLKALNIESKISFSPSNTENVLSFNQETKNESSYSLGIDNLAKACELEVKENKESYSSQNLFLINSEEEKSVSTTEDLFNYSDLIYRGRILNCYLLCEFNFNFYIIDMHAAHERVNYNKIITKLENKSINSQKLLIPEVVNLNPEEVTYCIEHKDLFLELGFEIDAFSSDSIVIRSTPATLGDINIKAFIMDAIELDLPEAINEKYKREIEHLAARISCHASLRTGDDISEKEVYVLFKDLDQAILANACPHGRPIYRKFAKPEIEKWFGRIK